MLYELAADFPSLRPAIAENPATYSELLAWLAALDEPAIDDALARRPARVLASAAEDSLGSPRDGRPEHPVELVPRTGPDLETAVIGAVGGVTAETAVRAELHHPAVGTDGATTAVLSSTNPASPRASAPETAASGGRRSRKKPALVLLAIAIAVAVMVGVGAWLAERSGLLDRELGGEVAVVARGDGYVRSDTPDSKHGTENQLWTLGPEPELISYLGFDLPLAPEGTALVGASLRVRTNTSPSAGSTSPLDVSGAAEGFVEDDLTFGARPQVSALLGRLPGDSQPDTEYTIPVDVAYLEGLLGGTCTLVLSATAGQDGLGLWSREFGQRDYAPALILDFRTPTPTG